MTNYRHPTMEEAALLSVAHSAIGRAIAHWQHLETALYLLTHCLMDADHKITSIVFFHIKSAENRIGLLDKLCWNGVTQRVYDKGWKSLRKRLSNLIEIRNGLAHFELSTFTPDSRHPTDFPVAITAHHLDVAALRSGATRGLYLERLNAMGDEFTEMAEDVLSFMLDSVPDCMHRAKSLPANLQSVLEKADAARQSGGTP